MSSKFFAFCLVALPCLVKSQKVNENFKLHIHKSSEKISIDGVLSESTWKNAEVAGDFHMITPIDTGKAIQHTEIRMAYDDEHLYISLIFFNNAVKGNYTIESLRRDFAFNKNDNFLLAMDPFNNKTTGFSFGLSAFGAQWDGTMSNGAAVDLNWDTKWTSAVTFDENQWIGEMAIPFKSIRYKSGSKEWGINFSRLDLKANEKSAWAPVPRQFPSVSLAYTGVLVWDKAPPIQKNNISLIPYVLGYADEEKPTFKLGGDAKISLTPSLNLDLTINPDFSQADVDQQVTNLDRFELFFPERRQFFLENADLFANFGYSTIRPFFSRRIGLGTPIQAGARLSGNIDNNWRVGLMNIQTQENEDIGLPQQNFSVFTLQRKVQARSNINLMLVNKESFKDSDYSKFNRNLGIEYNYASVSNLWNGKAFLLKSFSPENFDQSNSLALAGHLEYKSVNWNWRIQQEHVGENFNPEVGFVPRKGFTKSEALLGYLYYLPKKSGLLSHGPAITQTFFFDPSLITSDRITRIDYILNFLNRSALTFSGTNQFIKLLADFDPIRTGLGKLSAQSLHTWNTYEIKFASRPQRLLTYNLSALAGGYFENGKRYAGSAELGYRFQPYLSLTSFLTYNNIELREPWGKNSFWVGGIKADLTLTNTLFFSNLYQYNEQLGIWNFNSRLQWRYQPASDLFIVFNSGELNTLEERKYWNLTLKLNYWLNI